jgi:hypothetical protein
LAGAWADPVSTSSAVRVAGASQREERMSDEFMRRGVFRLGKGPYNSTIVPPDGLLQVSVPQSEANPCARWSFYLES